VTVPPDPLEVAAKVDLAPIVAIVVASWLTISPELVPYPRTAYEESDRRDRGLGLLLPSALLALLTPTIAAAVDPLRSLAVLAGMVAHATAGTVLTRAGDPLPLPGLPSHVLLRPGSRLLPVAVEELDGHQHASFLCPYRERGAGDRQVKVTMLSCPTDLPKYLVAVALISPPSMCMD
jgi:hypothetical protein